MMHAEKVCRVLCPLPTVGDGSTIPLQFGCEAAVRFQVTMHFLSMLSLLLPVNGRFS